MDVEVQQEPRNGLCRRCPERSGVRECAMSEIDEQHTVAPIL